MNSLPRVMVVLIHYYGDGATEVALRSVLASDFSNLQVLVIDNGSTAAERELFQRLAGERLAFLQPDRNEGYTGAGNLGIRWALERGADFVILANQDIEIEPDAVTRLIAAAQASDLGVCSPVIASARLKGGTFAGGEVSLWLGTSRNLAAPKRADAPYPVGFAAGSFFCLRSDVLKKVGELDPRYFFSWEDVDMCFRARSAGFNVCVVPSVTIKHTGETSGAGVGRTMLASRNRWIFVSSNASGAQLLVFALSRVAVALPLRVLVSARSPRPYEDLRAYFRGVASALRGRIRGDERINSAERTMLEGPRRVESAPSV